MHRFKVVYLETTFLKKKLFNIVGRVDGLTTAKELEALLVEQDKNGFDLVSINPLSGNVMTSIGHDITSTPGFIVTFKKKTLA